MSTLSPLTQRIVAVGLLVLLALLAIQFVAVPVVQGISERREELANLRAREARLDATRRRLLPDASTMPSSLALKAPSKLAAEARLRALVAGSAAIAGAAVTLSPALPLASASETQTVRVGIAMTGSEAAVARFASLVEHGSPLIRFERWQLQTGGGPDQKLSLSAVAAAAWDSRP